MFVLEFMLLIVLCDGAHSYEQHYFSGGYQHNFNHHGPPGHRPYGFPVGPTGFPGFSFSPSSTGPPSFPFSPGPTIAPNYHFPPGQNKFPGHSFPPGHKRPGHPHNPNFGVNNNYPFGPGFPSYGNFEPHGYGHEYGHEYGYGHHHTSECDHIHPTRPYFPSGFDKTTFRPGVETKPIFKPIFPVTVTPVKPVPPVTPAPSKPIFPVTPAPVKPVPEEATTTTEEPSDPFAIDIRFKKPNNTQGENKTITKRSADEVEDLTRSRFPDNSLHSFGFWHFPTYHSENPESLATCVHKKFECIPINKCKTASTGSNQRYCRFGDEVPYVCCEKLTANGKLLQKQDIVCGRKKSNGKSAAIIGGVNVQNANSFPWMVAIGQIDIQENVDWFCGGSLVSARTVVTAAHCLGRRSPDIVRLGEIDLTKSESQTMQEIFVWRRYLHPSYRPPAMYNDIALVYLDEPAEFNQFVRPVCLPQRTVDTSVGLLTGWGQLSFDADKSPVLQEVSVQVFNNSICDKFYSVGTAARRNFPKGILDTQMCAGDEQGGKDACQGDSGSPLVIEEDGNFVLSGIVSAGIGCGSKSFPGIYTRVSSFVPWILENII